MRVRCRSAVAVAASAEEAAKDMQRVVPLDVVIGDSELVLQLLANEDQPLRAGGRAILVLYH